MIPDNTTFISPVPTLGTLPSWLGTGRSRDCRMGPFHSVVLDLLEGWEGTGSDCKAYNFDAVFPGENCQLEGITYQGRNLKRGQAI